MDREKTGGVSEEAVTAATGKGWNEWVQVINRAGGATMTHKEIADMLHSKGIIESYWWCQTVTVGYEYLTGRRVKGETADAGFQLGVTRTINAPVKKVWRYMTSPVGRRVWLGDVKRLSWKKGAEFTTADGLSGEIRTVADGSKVRFRLDRKRSGSTTIQLSLVPTGTPSDSRTSVRFHQEHLNSARDRAQMKKHWDAVLDALEDALTS